MKVSFVFGPKKFVVVVVVAILVLFIIFFFHNYRLTVDCK